MSVCCPALDGVCEPVGLGPGPDPPALETDVSGAMLPELRCPMSTAFKSSLKSASLERDALVSSCAVDPSGEEVTPLAGCTTVDDSVACVAVFSPLT